MAGMDDIDLFGAPPVTGSTRDRDLDRLERMVRGRYIDPLEQKAKDMVKNQVVQALSGIEGFTGAAIAQVVALADSPDPNDKLVFNQIASRLNLPINIRRMGDDYMASKRFEGALGRNSSVDVSAYRPDEGETQYSLSAQKRFPNFLGKNSSAGVSARVSTMGDPEIGARFEKRFADGGEVDIFEAEAPRRSPDAYRRDGSLKSQTGLIGPIINKHSGKPMTELSIGVEIGGREVEIPSMVPTLTEEERILLQNLRIGVDPMPKSIVIKAKRHAMERIKSGLSPFLPAEPQNMNLGGSVSTMMGRTPEPELPKLTPAQLANIGGAFADPLGMVDITGEYPEFPAAGVSTADMVMQGPRSPSLMENLREGNYGSAALQSVGVIPVVGGVARAIRGVAKGADRLAKAQKAGFDTETVYYHGADADITGFRMPSRETGQTKTVGTGVFMSSSPEVAGSYAKGENAVLYPVYVKKSEFLRVRPATAGEPWSKITTKGLVVEFPDGTVKPASEVFDLETSSTSTDNLARIAREKGHKGLIIENVVDASVGSSGLYRQEALYLKNKGYDVNPAANNQSPAAREKYMEVPVELRREARDHAKAKLYQPSNVVVSLDPKNIRSVNADFEDLDSPELLKAEGGEIRKFSKGGILDLIVKGDFDPRFDPRVKEQDMLRNLEAEIIGSNQTQPMPRLALSELEGEDFVTSMTDRTRAGGDVKSINRVQLVDPIHLPGGQDFMFNNPSAVWASAEMPSRQILELARDLRSNSGKDPLYIPWRMAPTGGDFSTTTGELMLGYAAANMTKATKKALDKAMRSYRTTGSMAKGKRVGAGRKIEGWKGIDDPSAVQAWRNAPDAVRKELMNMMDVQFRNKGGLSIGAARLINADPKQLTARDAGIQNVGRIFADIDIFDSAHPSYPFAVPGGGVGVLENASAATVFDLLPKARFGDAQKKVKDPANPTQQEIRALQMKPYGGTITEDILRRMEARGVDVNSIVGLTGGALTFTLLSAGLVTPQEVQAGALKEFGNSMRKANEMGLKTDQVLYHGSTFDIEEFVPSSNTDNDFGQGTYLTISPSDASRNYAGEGPDLTSRINSLSESIQESLESDWDLNPDFWGKINDPEVFAKLEKLVDEFEENRDRGVLEEAANLAAKTILKGQNEGVIYPVFVNNKDFAVIGGEKRTVIDIDKSQYYDAAEEEIFRTDFDSDEAYEDAIFEYANELESSDYESQLADLTDSLRSSGANEETVGKVIISAIENDQIDLTEINDIIRNSYNEDFATGELLNNGQIMQDLLTSLGYKGVVDNTTGQKFANIASGGMHTIVFPGNENLIRSINAKFDPAKADSPNILASAPPILAPAAAGLGAMGAMQEARAATLQAEGAPFEVGLDALTAAGAPIVGGLAGLAEFTQGLPRRIAGDLTDEESAARIKALREGVSGALNYDPTSEIGREISQKAQEGIAGLLQPIVESAKPQVEDLLDYIRADEQRYTPLGALYRGGKYVYEDIFGEPEREATKSAMDVAI